MEVAGEADLDLVEVSPNAEPPVCKLADFGKMMYQQQKKHNESKKKQHKTQIKEIRLRPKTDEHDRNVKLGKAREFLERGNKVLFTMQFRGREVSHAEIGKDQFSGVANLLSDVAKIESKPSMTNKRMSMVLAPLSQGANARKD
jgi:translation initiation factor IF-3